MPTRIAINGFGRTGRAAFKVALAQRSLEVVGINDLTDPETLAHLLEYDTVYGIYPKDVKAIKNAIKVNNQSYKVTAIKDPEKLPWKKLNVDVVLECTGRFTKKADAEKHLKAGAKKVVISAPAKSEGVETYVIGVNEKTITNEEDIISNASCTTNCIAPVIKVLNDTFGVKKAFMTTVHSYTGDQNLVDGPHRDLRRARAAAHNIIPTTTGAAIATTKAIPGLDKCFDGFAIRVPTITGSIADITALLKKKTTTQKLNNALTRASKSDNYRGILEVIKEPVVSSDIIGNSASSIVDLKLTKVMQGDLVKVVSWYDNEWGYANRLVEMVKLFKNKK